MDDNKVSDKPEGVPKEGYDDVLGVPPEYKKEEVKTDLVPKDEIKDDLAVAEKTEPTPAPSKPPAEVPRIIEKDGVTGGGAETPAVDKEKVVEEMKEKVKKMEGMSGGETGTRVSSEPANKVPGGFVSKPGSEESLGMRGSVPGEIKEIKTEKKKKGFPLGVVFLILILIFGSLLAIIFLGPMVQEDETETERVFEERSVGESGESGVTEEEEFPEDTTGGIGKGNLPVEDVEYKNEELGFTVKHSNARQIIEDTNSKAGNRVVFWLNSGLNFIIHVGEEWSYENPERVEEAYTSTPVGIAYEFVGDPNQKILDFEKGEMKYTIQCVHQEDESVIEECNDFLTSFAFIE